jgi:hypothetical protein
MDEPRSQSERGDEFRDSVKRLLQITPGCTNVQTELLIGTQAMTWSL